MKKWWKSKTLWVNVISAMALAVQELSGNQVIDPKVAVYVLTTLNFVLRLITTQKVG